jgi:hypothetical protein
MEIRIRPVSEITGSYRITKKKHEFSKKLDRNNESETQQK